SPSCLPKPRYSRPPRRLEWHPQTLCSGRSDIPAGVARLAHRGVGWCGRGGGLLRESSRPGQNTLPPLDPDQSRCENSSHRCLSSRRFRVLHCLSRTPLHRSLIPRSNGLFLLQDDISVAFVGNHDLEGSLPPGCSPSPTVPLRGRPQRTQPVHL